MLKPDLEKYLQKGKWVRVASRYGTQEGEVGEVSEDSFELLVVSNPYEHFSNISAPAEYKKHTILKKDVEEISWS
jgi:hypothetical protein